ncbi:MAG TPA: hypothetical protein VEV82_06375 [Actinomycetota bacterium]|nr:hypothetical protein [Actinomycetota bacterium]
MEFYTDEGSMVGSLGNGYDSIEEAVEDVERAIGLEPSAWTKCSVPKSEDESVTWTRIESR